MPISDVPLCIDLTDTALNGDTQDDRMAAWGGLYQHLHGAVTARTTLPPRDDMIDVLLNAEIDGEKLQFGDIVGNAMLLVQAGLETTASAMSFRLPLSRDASRGTRPPPRRSRADTPGRRGVHPVLGVDTRYSADGYAGSQDE